MTPSDGDTRSFDPRQSTERLKHAGLADSCFSLKEDGPNSLATSRLEVTHDLVQIVLSAGVARSDEGRETCC